MSYRVKKVLNNNVVLAAQGFQEVIVVGLGIGFKLRVHQVIPNDKIEKIFELKREDIVKTTALAKDISEADFLKIYRILESVSKEHGLTLDPHAYIALVDHIHFAIQRWDKGHPIHNLMLYDLKILYEDAFRFSEALLSTINTAYAIELPYDEVGFLTMHVVNGLYSEINNQSSQMTETIFGCLNIIRDFYLIPLKLDDLKTQRIMIHIKMLLQRVLGNSQLDDGEKVLYNVFDEFERAYICARQIQKYIENRLGVKIHTQELVYLTIHLNRLAMSL